jgi:hypothetical protein
VDKIHLSTLLEITLVESVEYVEWLLAPNASSLSFSEGIHR